MYQINELHFHFELPKHLLLTDDMVLMATTAPGASGIVLTSRESLVMLEMESYLKTALDGCPYIGAVIAEFQYEEEDTGDMVFNIQAENQSVLEHLLGVYGMDETLINELMVSICAAAAQHPHVMVH